MTPEIVRGRGADFALYRLAPPAPGETAPLLIWAHGWGHTHRNMQPLAEALRRPARSILLDLPGFGAAPPPPAAWGTADYADAAAEWLGGMPAGRRIWIGHSFGCRVGLQLAARHPGVVDGLFLIAAAGLRPRRSLSARARLAARRAVFRTASRLVPEGPARDRLRGRFGSADYRAAGPALRAILVKSVNEDLTAAARAVRCPTVLVYGADDRETPPEIGERLAGLVPGSQLVVLRGFDHWSVLTEGRHQIAHLLSEFLEQFA